MRHASMRLQSQALDVAQLSEALGLEPSRAAELGSPVSSRRPDGPRRAVASWHRESPVVGDEIGMHLAALRPVLAALHRARAADPELVVDLVLMVDARPLGALITFDPDVVAELAAARCGLVVDSYDSDPGED